MEKSAAKMAKNAGRSLNNIATSRGTGFLGNALFEFGVFSGSDEKELGTLKSRCSVYHGSDFRTQREPAYKFGGRASKSVIFAYVHRSKLVW
jgi:hypothetical protein